MKQLYLAGLLAIVSVLSSLPLSAQKAHAPLTPYERFANGQRTLPGREIICPASTINAFTRAGIQNNQGARTSAVTSSTFIVDYTGFSTDAQAAFQYAVDIWSTIISSPVPIRIRAQWVVQDPKILGSARPATTRVGSDGTQWAFGQYAVALAEKIARRPLNDPAEADIVASFNKNFNWYFGTDGKTPAGQYDLVSVVLHEIGHGLGFVGSIQATAGNTLASYGDNPSPFDHFLENNAGSRLVNNQLFANGSAALFNQLIGGQLYFNGPIVQQRDGVRPRLYAPPTYVSGSTLYHLNETTYPAGNINSLMTYAIGPAEAIHTPGPLVIDMFTDIEWKTTSVLHTPLIDQEEIKDLTFSTQLISDTTITPGSVRFFYHTGPLSATAATPFTEGALTNAGANTYTFLLPAARAQGNIQYYFQAKDASGRTYSNPGKNLTSQQVYYQIVLGPDNVPPRVTYTPAGSSLLVSQADTIPIYASVTDDRSFGIDTTYIDYLINGVAQPVLPLRFSPRDSQDSLYRATIKFASPLKAGDRVQYRIIARDKSRNRNQTTKPATGYYEVAIVAPQPTVRTQYSNTFTNVAASGADFAGTGFSITQPASFSDAAIHSDHPYSNGSDQNYQSNYTYTLLTPIQIKANPDSAVMRFNEIVLVEPNEPGSVFVPTTPVDTTTASANSGFYDYVIVEGSKDNGKTWLRFLEGYNSREQTDWLNTFNSSFISVGQDQSSAAVGTPGLYKRREISLQNNANFRANDQVLIRFRLFADQLTHGWGWAIDNLQIQVPPPPPVLAVAEPVKSAGTFLVYPNPVVTGALYIDAQLASPVTEASVSVQTATGQTLRQQTVFVSGVAVKTQLDMGQLPAGIYFLKLQAGDTILTKKVLVTK